MRSVISSPAIPAFALILAAAISGWPQRTIFNVPTSDVLDRGKVSVELDVSFSPNSRSAFGRFSSFVPRVVVGTCGNVEIGLNLTGNTQPAAD
jgi:hypothetical protein